jgi:hypothetical protein
MLSVVRSSAFAVGLTRPRLTRARAATLAAPPPQAADRKKKSTSAKAAPPPPPPVLSLPLLSDHQKRLLKSDEMSSAQATGKCRGF